MPQIRILQCLVCKTLESLPDYKGPPEEDTLLSVLVSRHKFESGEPHKGQLYDVDKKHWDSPSTREAIIAQINERSGHTGLDPEFYAVRDTFEEDALKCFAAHNRNPACPDYRSDKKRLYPDTGADRKDSGLSVKSRPNTFLCDFCPVHSLVQSAARRGAYS